MVTRTLVALALIICCSTGYAEEAVEIPLSEVWGINFRETKPASQLEPKRDGEQIWTSLTRQIHRALSTRDLPSDKSLRSGFAVFGEGREALEQVHAVLVKERPHQDSFPEDSEISVVFFTREMGFMQLRRVERTGTTITIEYCLGPARSNPLVSPKVAIIPLGKLAPGNYQVNIIGFTKKTFSLADDCEPVLDERAKKLICQPFEFSVVENMASKKNS